MTERTDLAIVGAGAAGTFVARAMRRARPDWRVVLFERTDRIGGRLRSIAVPGLDHPIELGGMRFQTVHPRVTSVVEELGLPWHRFDGTDGSERTYLRGRFGAGAGDPSTGIGYELDTAERGRSAADLGTDVFLRAVPGAATLDPVGFRAARATATYLERPIIDWSIAEALASVRSPEGHSYIADTFGYDSGIRAFNLGDALQFYLGGGNPRNEARTPDAGMAAIPHALAREFVRSGGEIRHRAELASIHATSGHGVSLRFASGDTVEAHRVVLATPIPALRLVAAASPALDRERWTSLLDSVEGFPGMKLYLWYPRPWWRPSVTGIRTTTDLSVRKVFYVDTASDRPAALLAMYTDGRHTDPWRALAGDASDGAPAPPALLDEVGRQLAELHPEVSPIPEPSGSAIQHWGADPHEVAWSFWRAGFNSDEMMQRSVRPEAELPIYVAGETFSRAQSWVEGALETAEMVVDRLLAESA